MADDQSQFQIRFGWGIEGLLSLGKSTDAIIIVDALSFSTCVDVAVSRGASVFPFPWQDERAAEYAAKIGAELAGPRGEPGAFSLSPTTMFHAKEGTRIVLPSPNGSELTVRAQELKKTVLTGCFRNALAVADYARKKGGAIAVIAAGERGGDGSWRKAEEDISAAGAILANLKGTASPDAKEAIHNWDLAKRDLKRFLSSIASGQELIERGWGQDVQIAAEIDVSKAVPLLGNGEYRSA